MPGWPRDHCRRKERWCSVTIPARLALLQAELAREGKAERYLTVGTRDLHSRVLSRLAEAEIPGVVAGAEWRRSDAPQAGPEPQ